MKAVQEELPNLDEEIIWKSAELMEIALNLSIYRYTLAFSLGNLILMV